MIAFIPPTVDGALWLVALGTLLTLALLHVALLPGVFFHGDLSRPQAYMLGAGVVLAYFTALYLLARNPVPTPLQPILDIWFLFIAGAIPIVGFRYARDHAHMKDEAPSGNNNPN